MVLQPTPIDIVKDMWKKKFFCEERDIIKINSTFRNKGYNFEYKSIYSALSSSNFLSEKTMILDDTSFEMPSFIQKFPWIKDDDEQIIYSKGSSYDFYQDMKNILCSAKLEITISDAHVDNELIQLYLDKLNEGISINILTNPNNPFREKFLILMKKFSQNPDYTVNVRESNDCHDRYVFADSNVWVFGNSIKNSGKKATYLIKIKKEIDFSTLFNSVWTQANRLIEQ